MVHVSTVRWLNSSLFFLRLYPKQHPKHGTSWSVKFNFTFISMWHQSADRGSFRRDLRCSNQHFPSAEVHINKWNAPSVAPLIKSSAQKPTKMPSLDFQCNFSQFECIRNISASTWENFYSKWTMKCTTRLELMYIFAKISGAWA